MKYNLLTSFKTFAFLVLLKVGNWIETRLLIFGPLRQQPVLIKISHLFPPRKMPKSSGIRFFLHSLLLIRYLSTLLQLHNKSEVGDDSQAAHETPQVNGMTNICSCLFCFNYLWIISSLFEFYKFWSNILLFLEWKGFAKSIDLGEKLARYLQRSKSNRFCIIYFEKLWKLQI